MAEVDAFGPPEPIAPRVDPLQTGTAESFLAKAAESVPVLGAAYNKGVAALESLSPFFSSRHLERGSGEYDQRTYAQALADQQALMERRAKDNPLTTTAGKVVGNVAGYAALPAASMATLPAAMLTGAGVSGLDTAARGGDAGEVAGSVVGGGAGGALGYGAGQVIGTALGHAADWQALKALGATTGRGRGDIKAVIKPLKLKPGELAQVMREQGIVGGLKRLSDSAAGAEGATSKVGQAIGDLINEAHGAGGLIPVEEANMAIAGAKTYGTRPKFLKNTIKEVQGEISDLAEGSGYLSHPQLQEFLASRRPEANAIEVAIKRNQVVSPENRAFLNTYNAGRALQDAKLNEVLPGGGDTARQLRRLMAVDATAKRVLEQRANVVEASHPVGLLGTLSALEGVRQIASGQISTGVPMLALSLGSKITAPYRANVLTSLFSRAQPVMQGGLPAVAGAGVGEGVGARRARAFEDAQEPSLEDFGPPEPLGAPPPDRVAKKGKP